jgi:hypothetical protein
VPKHSPVSAVSQSGLHLLNHQFLRDMRCRLGETMAEAKPAFSFIGNLPDKRTPSSPAPSVETDNFPFRSWMMI